MQRKHYLLLVALAVITGLIGGAFSSWVMSATRDELGHEESVKAEEFRLVDAEGKTIVRTGKMGTQNDHILLLFDSDGNVVWRMPY